MKVLLIDDEIEYLRALNRVIKRHTDYTPIMLQGVDSLEELDQLDFDLVISDQRMPGFTGTDVFEYLQRQGHAAKRILLSGYADFEQVVTSFNQGAINRFLSKPVTNEQLLEAIQGLLAPAPSRSEQTLSVDNSFHGIVSIDPVMKKLFTQVEQVSRSESSVYITGETGTGKELLARAIHNCSPRKKSAFVPLNCANLADDLAESQLFGHVKGAFTGAISQQQGLLEQAHNGTLFLDEVVDLSPRVQSKLLRVLQEKEFLPVGGSSVRQFNARLVSAAAMPLREAVALGDFREDLFYRLNVVPLKLPPLRERKDDIELLFRYFLSHYSMQPVASDEWELDAELRQWLVSYGWPGNVRELQNICAYITSCMVQKQLLISLAMLPEDLFSPALGPAAAQQEERSPVFRRPAEMSKVELIQALERSGYNKAKAARALGISRMTMYRLIKRFDLEQELES